MIQKIGTLIWKNLIENNQVQKELCRGLCSQSELSKILMGNKVPDYFLLERLLNRVGKTNKYFEYIVSQKEYELLELRYQIQKMVRKKDLQAVNECFLKYQESCKPTPLHKQYILYIKSILQIEQGMIKEGIHSLEESIACTVQMDLQESIDHNIMLGGEEIKLLLLFYRLNYKYGKEEREQTQLLIEGLKNYTEHKQNDMSIKGDIYPKLCEVLAEVYVTQERYEEMLSFCKKAKTYMERTMRLVGMKAVLFWMIYTYERLGREEEELLLLKNQYKYLTKVYEAYEVYEDSFYFIESDLQEFSLDWEIVKGMRKTYALSQGELASYTYRQESISRIETKKRKVNHKKFQELTKEVGVIHEFYQNPLLDEDFQLLELKHEIEFQVMKKRLDRARELLEQLKKFPIKQTNYNQQYFQLTETLIQFLGEELSPEETLIELRKVLYLTKKRGENPFLYHLTKQEGIILNNIAICYRKMGELEKAIQIWRELLKYYKSGGVNWVFYNSNVGVILYNLALVLEEKGEYEEAYGMCQKGIDVDKNSYRGDMLGIFLCEKADILMKKGEKEKARNYYRCSFWVFLVVGNSTLGNMVQEAYKAYYHCSIYEDS